jgi:acylphosphatase
MIAARFLVSGRVQGVAFRAHARRQALARGLRGHAINLADGRVEVVACGEPDEVDAFASWLAHGPPHAEVEGVERTRIDVAAVAEGFATG